MNNQWTQEQRNLLDNILDELIPANREKGISSAGVAGVGEFIAVRAAGDNNVFMAINTVLTEAESMAAEVNPDMVRQLESRHAKSFSVLIQLTYMGYYSRPEGRSAIGLGNWPIHPRGYEVPVESAQLIGELTAPVVARGPLYREVDANKANSS